MPIASHETPKRPLTPDNIAHGIPAPQARAAFRRAISRRALPSVLLTRILVWLGFRSDCCGARLYEPVGWDRGYCSECDRRVL